MCMSPPSWVCQHQFTRITSTLHNFVSMLTRMTQCLFQVWVTFLCVPCSVGALIGRGDIQSKSTWEPWWSEARPLCCLGSWSHSTRWWYAQWYLLWHWVCGPPISDIQWFFSLDWAFWPEFSRRVFWLMLDRQTDKQTDRNKQVEKLEKVFPCTLPLPTRTKMPVISLEFWKIWQKIWSA